ncbi:MAG TPA: hypothetical protein PK514_12270 [Spirochaetota bacterium]|nr:hypothetical protein [Spirochaetota bacterium]
MNHQESPVKGFFYGTVFYSYLFIIFQLTYNYFFRGLLLDQSIGTVYGAGRSPLFGIILLLAIAAGTYAVMVKCRQLRISGVRFAGIPAFVVWVLNWVIVIVMVLTAVKSFGIDISKRSDMFSDRENIIIICSILGAMLQAGIVIGFLARIADPYEKTVSNLKRVAADISAFIFLCVSYTVVWETIVYRTVATQGRCDISTASGIFELTGAALSFILLYPPMRFSFLLQDIHDYKHGRGRFRIVVSYIAVVLTGMIPLVKL